MSVIEELLARKPETRTVTVPLNPDLARRYLDAKAEVNVLQDKVESLRRRLDKAGDDPSQDLQDEYEEAQQALVDARDLVEELRPQVDEAKATFVMGSIAQHEFDEIKGRKECRPTSAQINDARRMNLDPPMFNQQNFEPLFVAASCLSVKTPGNFQEGLSEDEARSIWKSDAWNVGVRNLLVSAAFEAYQSFTDPESDPGKGSGTTDNSVLSLLTALQQASRTRSS